MFTYEITPSGPNGFQVRVKGPSGTHVIRDFCSQAAAETFAGWMRELDAGDTSITPMPSLESLSDARIEDPIRGSRKARAAAEKA